MKNISTIKTIFQQILVWILSIVKTVNSAFPKVKPHPVIFCDRSPEGEREMLVRAVRNFELKKRGDKCKTI